MTKEILFKKYAINETHSNWNDVIDNFISVEIYRLMHNGELPTREDESISWVTKFLDKLKDLSYASELMKTRSDFGSLYLTAKRLVYKHAEALTKT